jgi:hypothetical protein
MSTSTSISQFLALRASGDRGVQGDRTSGVQGDRTSGVLDQHPGLAVALAVGVAVGDARSSGTRPGRSRREQLTLSRASTRAR